MICARCMFIMAYTLMLTAGLNKRFSKPLPLTCAAKYFTCELLNRPVLKLRRDKPAMTPWLKPWRPMKRYCWRIIRMIKRKRFYCG